MSTQILSWLLKVIHVQSAGFILYSLLGILYDNKQINVMHAGFLILFSNLVLCPFSAGLVAPWNQMIGTENILEACAVSWKIIFFW